MIPENLVFISVQPHDLYFSWQIEVQINNFRKFGVSDRMHVLVWYPNTKKLIEDGKKVEWFNALPWIELMKKYKEVNFYFYEDSGAHLELYIPQIRPHTLIKHFDKYPELSSKSIFYHDSDIIFNYLPNFENLCNDDINWVSNTSWYLDYNYLRKKEIQGGMPENYAVNTLCEIGGVTIDTFKEYVGKTGGAQYVLKNIDSKFWKIVNRQVLEIRKAFYFSYPGSINSRYFKSEEEGFQSWCADMWAINMALWSTGKITGITKELDFCLASDGADAYLKRPIYHGAGTKEDQEGVFVKSKWMNMSPIGIKHDYVLKSSASYYYAKEIENIK